MYERFTDRARKVMALANQEAQRFNHEYIGTEHILLGLIKEGSGVGVNVLKNLHVDPCEIRSELEKLLKSGPEMVTMGRLPQTPRAKRVIEYAIEEMRNLNHIHVGTEHLLLGLLREQDGVAAQVLMNLGLRLEDAREGVISLVGSNVASGENQAPDEASMKVLVLEKRLEPGKYKVLGWVLDGDNQVLIVKLKRGCVAVTIPISICKLEGKPGPLILEIQEAGEFRIPIIHYIEPIGEWAEQG